jgi:hypothetical protein
LLEGPALHITIMQRTRDQRLVGPGAGACFHLRPLLGVTRALAAAALAFGCVASFANAFQGQPVGPDDREVGLIVRELVEGSSSALGGQPVFTITGTPGAGYFLFGAIDLQSALEDVAAQIPGIRGSVSAPISLLDPALFVPTSGVYGVIPPSGVQDLNFSITIPAGLAGAFLDVQVFLQQPTGEMDLSDGQLRQFQPPPATALGWAAGTVYPGSSFSAEWADVEQGDVDGDGDNDTIAAGTNALRMWMTTGGTHVVSAAGLLVSTGNSTSLELADLDNDGHLDIAAGFLNPPYLRVWRNNGLDAAGTWLGFTQLPSSAFTPPFLTGCHPADVEVADADGDGFRDVMLACASDPVTGERNRLHFNTFATTGALTFSDVTTPNLPVIFDDSEDCEFLDFDLDGDLDIVIANVDGTTPNTPFGQGGDYMLINQGFAQGGIEGMYLAPLYPNNPVPASGDESLDVAVGDIDGDGLPDLYFSNWAASPTPGNFTFPPVAVRDRLLLRRFDALGNPIYTNFSQLLPDAVGTLNVTFGTDAEIFDVDFDGDLDIVSAMGTLGSIQPVALSAMVNRSVGIHVIQNNGTTVTPFPRSSISAASSFDLRDIEHGDWRESAAAGGFGRYFDKDMGCAITGSQRKVTTVDHL